MVLRPFSKSETKILECSDPNQMRSHTLFLAATAVAGALATALPPSPSSTPSSSPTSQHHQSTSREQCTPQLTYVSQVAVNFGSDAAKVAQAYDFYANELGFTMISDVTNFTYVDQTTGQVGQHPYFGMSVRTRVCVRVYVMPGCVRVPLSSPLPFLPERT